MESHQMITKPVFLVGAERSGTTMLRLMLDGHPSLAWNNEFEYCVDLMPDEEGYPDINKYYSFLLMDRIFLLSGFTIDKNLTYPELVDSFLVQKRGDKTMVGATVHRHFDRLLRIWPDARFVHLVRDGRDVARSVVEMGWAGNVWTGCDRWIEAENLWKIIERRLTKDASLTIRYEDLIQHPVPELERICAFCGIAFSPAMLTYPARSTYRAPDPTSLMRWKKMAVPDLQLVEAKIGQLLVERGYPLSQHPPLVVSPKMQKRLLRQDRLKRFQFRLKRTGISLFLEDILSRRIGIASWQKNVRVRIDAITNASLK